MKISTLYNKIFKLIKEYNIIENGDKIALCISGGKDSMAMLYLLNGIRKSKKIDFSIFPVILDMGFDNFDLSLIEDFVENLGLELKIIKTSLGKLIFEDRKEKNPCSLCSKMRRGILNENAKKMECNKIALGHHQDDIVSTLMLSLMYEGAFKTISPISYMNKASLNLIRPLSYIEEREVVELVSKYDLPVLQSPCPVDKTTKRREMEKLLKELSMSIPNVKENIFGAIKSSNFLKNPSPRQTRGCQLKGIALSTRYAYNA